MTQASAYSKAFTTSVHAVGLGLNAQGRFDASPLHTVLLDQFPVFVSEFRRQGRAGLLTPGGWWLFRDSQPWLVAFIVSETPHSTPRLRHLESALLQMQHNWQREGLHDLMLVRFLDGIDWNPFQALITETARKIALPFTIYEPSQPGTAGQNHQPAPLPSEDHP